MNETTEEKITRLESELAEGQVKLGEQFCASKLDELNTIDAELTNLRRCVEIEKEVKEEYRQRFANSFSTPEDFERLWSTRLRDDAMIETANQGGEIGKGVQHPMYKDF